MTEETAQAIEMSLANEAESVRLQVGLPVVGFKRLSEDATIPSKAHATDSGFDLVASADVIVQPGETVVVPTGIAVQLPAGFEATVRPRSGVTAKTKLRVQLGTIDEGYGGEIGVIVDNTADSRDSFGEVVFSESLRNLEGVPLQVDGLYPYKSYRIRKGDRIAQLVIARLPDVEAIEVFDVEESARGANGFGSSGVTAE